MNLSKSKTLVFIITICLLSACSKVDEFKPYLEGDIIGYAYCFDEYGNKQEDFSGIKVYTEPGREFNAITDENGRYVIKNVINGTYNLSFEKEGFGTMKLFSVKHLGGKSTVIHYYYGEKTPFIYQNITTEIVNLVIVHDSIKVGASIPGNYKPDRLTLRLFFSTEENFNIESAQAVKNMDTYKNNDIYNSYSSVTEGLPFEHGDTVYYKAGIYTTTFAQMLYNYYYISGTDTYYDYNSNKTIYPNLSKESKEYAFIMP